MSNVHVCSLHKRKIGVSDHGLLCFCHGNHKVISAYKVLKNIRLVFLSCSKQGACSWLVFVSYGGSFVVNCFLIKVLFLFSIQYAQRNFIYVQFTSSYHPDVKSGYSQRGSSSDNLCANQPNVFVVVTQVIKNLFLSEVVTANTSPSVFCVCCFTFYIFSFISSLDR